jgi:hypothetical protein
MSRMTRIQVIAILEKRIKDFVESATNEKMWPPLSLTSGQLSNQEAMIGLIMMRLSKPRFLREHFTDQHVPQHCNLCQTFISNYRYEFEGKAREFLSTNRELFAELNLLG